MDTKYRNMEDQHLLNLIDAVRQKSPIIEELCNRLEQRPAEDYIQQEEPEVLELDGNCPVCQAHLISEYNIVKDQYNLIAK